MNYGSFKNNVVNKLFVDLPYASQPTNQVNIYSHISDLFH